MQEKLARLYELQQLDSGIAQHRTWIASLDDGSKSGRNLAAAQGQLDALQKCLAQAEAESRNKELELKSADEDRTSRMSRAYGGTVADAKELAALERKIEELNRRRDKLETEILELMDQIEGLTKQVAQQEKVVAQGQALHDKIVGDYQQARGKLEEEITKLAARRAELVTEIEPDLLREYEAMRGKLEGVAVAGIEGNMCKACRNVLPQSALAMVKQGKMIVRCQNCRRMLFPSEAW